MPEWLREWWPVMPVVVPLTGAVIGWTIRMGLASRKDLSDGLIAEAKARAEALTAVETRLSSDLATIRAGQNALQNRTLKIETDITYLPSAEDIGEIKADLAGLRGTADATGRELTTLSRSVTRIEDFLLKAKS